MSDEEIIKALECCGKPYNICVECPMPNNIKDGCRCGEHLANYALDIINRQQEEIERLKGKCENTQIGYNFAQDETKRLKKDKYKLQKALNQSEDYRVMAKSEAVKEFAERLKRKIDVVYSIKNLQDNIDNLVKEMIGE